MTWGETSDDGERRKQLKRLLGAEELAGFEVVGLSGTSGGAVCALLAWSALLAGDPAVAGKLLEDFWADNLAATPLEQLVNAWVLWAARLENLDDGELVAEPPFPDRGSLRGRRRIGRFVREHLIADLHIDPTRMQVARDRVTWAVRAHRDGEGAPVRGRAEAELRAGQITALRLGG